MYYNLNNKKNDLVVTAMITKATNRRGGPRRK